MNSSGETITAIDLFCGAGGFSTALHNVCRNIGTSLALTAINHWPTAIETHRANYPNAKHICNSLEGLEPSEVHKGSLDVLLASPACTHHSNARGGKPRSDQSRASAWQVIHWAEQLRPTVVLVENVPEFKKWGPLTDGGEIIKSKVGETYSAWKAALESLGYNVEDRIVDSSDFGEAQSRRRVLIQGVLKGFPTWPTATTTTGKRTAEDIIDWSLRGKPIVDALCAKTRGHIDSGLNRYKGRPFIVKYYGNSTTVPVTKPLPTVTTVDRFGLIQSIDGVTHFRMIQPRESAKAMGFPDTYKICGNKREQTKQIGNAVSVKTMECVLEVILANMFEKYKEAVA